MALVVKNLPASADDVKDKRHGSVPGSGRSPCGEHSNPLQYSRLENPHGQRSLVATVHGVAKSWTRLSESGHKETVFVSLHLELITD